jgi:hypothetical protein
MSYRLAQAASAQVASPSLELFAQGAGCALACDFSNSDEFEAALIAQRRAEGRYDPHRGLRHLVVTGVAVAAGCGVLVYLIV